MSLLRILGLFPDEPMRCRWVLDREGGEPVTGEGAVTDLPQHAGHVQLILPAAQVLLARVRLPSGPSLRRDGPMLAFAVEDETLRDPDANQVTWIGSHGDEDTVAVVDKSVLQRWLDVLAAAAVRVDEIYCETLLLPWTAGEWSLAWDGREGFVRTGEFQGMATDCGDEHSPPLSLRLMLEEAEAREAMPASISLYPTMPLDQPAGEISAMPDIEVWQRELGVPVQFGGTWDWRAAPNSSADLLRGRKRRRNFSGLLTRLRPAALIIAAVLAIHAMALTADWILLASEQRALRQQMESRFRAIFPAAVAVVDPALQMRRKLVEARHAAGFPDNTDFLPLIESVIPGLKELAPGSLRILSYDSGNLTLELAIGEAAARRIVARLLESGLSADISSPSGSGGSGTTVIRVRAS